MHRNSGDVEPLFDPITCKGGSAWLPPHEQRRPSQAPEVLRDESAHENGESEFGISI